MKKFLQLGIIFFSILVTQNVYSQNVQSNAQNPNLGNQNKIERNDSVARASSWNEDNSNPARNEWRNRRTARWGNTGVQTYDYSRSATYADDNSYAQEGSSCAAESCAAPCEDQPMGECWCLYCRQEPCYYNDWKCVEDTKYCTKRCCRMVPQYYEVQRCKYVPQYYTETCCRQVPEYYDVQECIPCKKWVCEQKCRYIPRYYYKQVCKPECGPAGCAAK